MALHETFGAAILCGGGSKRMGCDKATLPFGTHSFLTALLDALRAYPEILLSASEPSTYGQFGLPVIPDRYPNCGPMAGLHAVLAACQSDALLCVSCDIPLFSAELGRFLCDSLRDGDDAVIVQTRDGGYHPLCGVYRKRAGEAMEACLQSGVYKVQRAFASLSVRVVALQDTPFSDDLLLNINTPEEYNALLGQFGK